MKTILVSAATVSLCLAVAACSDNSGEPAASFGPPTNVLAQSVDEASVGLRWGPPAGVVDTAVRAYIVSYGDVRDSIPPTPRQYLASALPQGITGFTLQAVSSEGDYSTTTGKSWAPAARYDSVFSIYEYDVSQLLRNSAFHIGSRTSSPSAVPVALAAQLPFDVYLVGQGGQPLTLRGGQMFNSAYDPFLFADRADAATSLDLYIDQFPSTYSRPEVTLRDNTIYYGQGYGEAGEVNYVRIHVRLGPGTYPNRTVIISISLQKVPSLQYALGPGAGRGAAPSVPSGPLCS
jgi:hypothetical protein